MIRTPEEPLRAQLVDDALGVINQGLTVYGLEDASSDKTLHLVDEGVEGIDGVRPIIEYAIERSGEGGHKRSAVPLVEAASMLESMR